MEFAPIKSQRLYQQVINQIKDLIYEGKLKKGDKLPSEREMTTMLGVSRASIREAFSALEMLGLIETRPGEGTFVSLNLEDKVIEPLSLIFMLEQDKQEDLFQLRKILEVECAKAAAFHATPEELQLMDEYVTRMEHSPDDEEINFIADRKLHYLLAKASNNTLLYHVLNAISEVMEVQIRNFRRGILHRTQNRAQLILQHRNIVDAVVSRDPEKAGEAMIEHMNYIKENVVFE